MRKSFKILITFMLFIGIWLICSNVQAKYPTVARGVGNETHAVDYFIMIVKEEVNEGERGYIDPTDTTRVTFDNNTGEATVRYMVGEKIRIGVATHFKDAGGDDDLTHMYIRVRLERRNFRTDKYGNVNWGDTNDKDWGKLNGEEYYIRRMGIVSVDDIATVSTEKMYDHAMFELKFNQEKEIDLQLIQAHTGAEPEDGEIWQVIHFEPITDDEKKDIEYEEMKENYLKNGGLEYRDTEYSDDLDELANILADNKWVTRTDAVGTFAEFKDNKGDIFERISNEKEVFEKVQEVLGYSFNNYHEGKGSEIEQLSKNLLRVYNGELYWYEITIVKLSYNGKKFIMFDITKTRIGTYNNEKDFYIEGDESWTTEGNEEEDLLDVFSKGHLWKPTNGKNGKLTTLTGKLLGIVQVVGSIVSVIMIIIIGIKYMLGSIEEKAKYKETAIPYFVGAVLLFGTVNIATVIYNFASKL